MPTYTINLNSLPSGTIVIPKTDSVTFETSATVQLNFGAPAGRGTPFNDGNDSFSVPAGKTEKDFKSDASGNYGFSATASNGASATADIDVVSDVMEP